MQFLGFGQDSRISNVMELMRALGEYRDPFDALRRYFEYLNKAFGHRGHLVLSTRGLDVGHYRLWRWRSNDGVEHLNFRDSWKDIDLPVQSGGVLGAIIKNRTPQIVHGINWAGDRLEGMLGGYQSLMAVPLTSPRLPLNWYLMLHSASDHFTSTHLEESVTRATLIGSLLDSLSLGQELASARAHIDSEIERMARIQRALLPNPIPKIHGLDICASYETFVEVGGDLYDFVPLASGQWCCFISDASGHGPASAVVAAMIKATLRACVSSCPTPSALLQALNWHLCQMHIEGAFATAFAGYYESDLRHFQYACAGHPPPPVISHDGRILSTLNAAGGFPLGVDSSESYEDASVTLHPGESLLLYSDGVTEAHCPAERMFGEEGIRQALQSDSGQKSARDIVDSICKRLLTHQEGIRPLDDQTLVALRCCGSNG